MGVRHHGISGDPERLHYENLPLDHHYGDGLSNTTQLHGRYVSEGKQNTREQDIKRNAL